MFLVSFKVLFVVNAIQHVLTGTYITSTAKEKWYVFKNRIALSTEKPVKQEDQIDYRSCISTCEAMGKSCLLVSILKNNTVNFRCTFYDNDAVSVQRLLTNVSAYVFKKGKGYCGNQCKILKSQNPCGNCTCKDSCGTMKSYTCDCSNSVKEKKTCEDIYYSGISINGRYLINPDGNGAFEVTCYVQKKDFLNRNICKSKIYTYIYSINEGYVYNRNYQSETTCRQYCYSFWKTRQYNAWIYNNYYCLCGRGSLEKQFYNYDTSSCILELSQLISDISILPTTIMLRRHSESDPSFWDKSLNAFYEGFSSADNIWIGLHQLERLTTAFLIDIKVLIVDNLFKDTITTYYRNVKVKSNNGLFVITVGSFDDNNARVEGFYDSSQLSSGKTFNDCNSLGSWWTTCSPFLLTPTAPSNNFGFGSIQDIYTITFLLLKK